jgi:hypothetical protein
MSFIKLTFQDITKKCHYPESSKVLSEDIVNCFPELANQYFIVEYFDGEDNIRVETDFDILQAKKFMESSNLAAKFTIEKTQKESEAFGYSAQNSDEIKKEPVQVEQEKEKTRIDEFLTPLNELVSQAKKMIFTPDLLGYFDKMIERTNGYTTCHFNIFCKGCERMGFEGVRYQCKICESFDLCEGCYAKYGVTHQHEFRAITDPDMISELSRGLVKNVICNFKSMNVVELQPQEKTSENIEDINSSPNKDMISNISLKHQVALDYLLNDINMKDSNFTPEQIHNVLLTTDGNIEDALNILMK